MDLFSTNALTRAVNSLQVVPSFLLETFFPLVQTETSEEVHFDVRPDILGMAPFVSPVVEGKMMTQLGYTTKTFKPAYIKPKHPITPQQQLKRRAGEALTGNLSPQQRMAAAVADTLELHRMLIDRRMEWMASQVLRTGAVTVSGDTYPSTTVDFGRDAALTFTMTGGARWNQSTSTPLDDLANYAATIQEKSGVVASTVVMDTAAWLLFRNHASVKERLALQRTDNAFPTMRQDAMKDSGARYMGMIDTFDIWVYKGIYAADSNGAVTPMLPSNTVLVGGNIEGTRAYGAIQDLDSLQATPIFTKSWTENDPSVRVILSQSAPLVVPYRVNGLACLTVV